MENANAKMQRERKFSARVDPYTKRESPSSSGSGENLFRKVLQSFERELDIIMAEISGNTPADRIRESESSVIIGTQFTRAMLGTLENATRDRYNPEVSAKHREIMFENAGNYFALLSYIESTEPAAVGFPQLPREQLLTASPQAKNFYNNPSNQKQLIEAAVVMMNKSTSNIVDAALRTSGTLFGRAVGMLFESMLEVGDFALKFPYVFLLAYLTVAPLTEEYGLAMAAGKTLEQFLDMSVVQSIVPTFGKRIMRDGISLFVGTLHDINDMGYVNPIDSVISFAVTPLTYLLPGASTLLGSKDLIMLLSNIWSRMSYLSLLSPITTGKLIEKFLGYIANVIPEPSVNDTSARANFIRVSKWTLRALSQIASLFGKVSLIFYTSMVAWSVLAAIAYMGTGANVALLGGFALFTGVDIGFGWRQAISSIMGNAPSATGQELDKQQEEKEEEFDEDEEEFDDEEGDGEEESTPSPLKRPTQAPRTIRRRSPRR